MAKKYEAVAHVRTLGVSSARGPAIAGLLREQLPTGAVIDVDRGPQDALLLTMRFWLQGNDAAEPQLQAREVVQAGLRNAGLTEDAAVLEDVSVKPSG